MQTYFYSVLTGGFSFFGGFAVDLLRRGNVFGSGMSSSKICGSGSGGRICLDFVGGVAGGSPDGVGRGRLLAVAPVSSMLSSVERIRFTTRFGFDIITFGTMRT